MRNFLKIAKSASFLIAIVILLEPICAEADSSAAVIHTYWSPHHRFFCQTRGNDPSDESVIFNDPVSRKTTTLLTTPRWACVIWSPDDAWFCVDDEWDPDNNRLHVYHAYHNGTTELVWSTIEAAPDTYWKVLGWQMDRGMIHVQANYAKDYDQPSKGWITQSYLISIFLPDQVTTEEAYEEAVKNQQRKANQSRR